MNSYTPKKKVSLTIEAQPNETTCGPTCLQAIYEFYNRPYNLNTLIKEVPELELGGTLGVMLGNHALLHGFDVTIYTYNMRIFDPIWFVEGVDIRDKLIKSRMLVKDKKKKLALTQYIQFLDNGGVIKFEDLTRSLLRKFLKKKQPLLTGLSSTYLYRDIRFNEDTNMDDEMTGEPEGHFVILHDFDVKTKGVMIADPYEQNPRTKTKYYTEHIDRVIGAILLGILTYDANFITIKPKG